MAKAGRYALVYLAAYAVCRLGGWLSSLIGLPLLKMILQDPASFFFWLMAFTGFICFVYKKPFDKFACLRLGGLAIAAQVILTFFEIMYQYIAAEYIFHNMFLIFFVLYSIFIKLLWMQYAQLAFLVAFPDRIGRYNPLPKSFRRPGTVLLLGGIVGANTASHLYQRWLYTAYTTSGFMDHLALLRGPRVVLAELPNLMTFCLVCYLFDRLYTAHSPGAWHRPAV